MLTAAAPAKINLGLHVLRRRADGYHDLATVFCRIGWADTVAAEVAAGGITMTCTDPALPTGAGNLCVQAAQALAEATGTRRGVRLHLTKRLPYGAGLGGGSSDAATTLRLCARLWGLDASDADLHAVAATLGADVPFFLLPAATPAAYATGIGDRLTPLTGAGGAPWRLPHPLVVVVPPEHVPTPAAYGLVAPHDADRPDLRAVVRTGDLARWRDALANDFEAPVAAAYPAVAAARAALHAAGAAYVSLSGSGSAVYGVFATAAAARTAAAALRTPARRVWTNAGRETERV